MPNQADMNHSVNNNVQPPREDEYVLKKQSSICTLTFDEIHSKSGKYFGSMNIDEFLANVWSPEEDEQSQYLRNEPMGVIENRIANQIPQPQHHNAAFSIPMTFCNKTIDQVWADINDDTHKQQLSLNFANPKREETMGEMTLEDFLVRAGVVQEAAKPSQEQCGSNFALPATADVEVGEVGTGLEIIVHPNSTDILSNNGANNTTIIDGPREVAIDRRKRRMIKNRQSAARSRARKQAYTVELEFKVNQLKEENKKLKKIVAIIRNWQPNVKGVKKIRRTISLCW